MVDSILDRHKPGGRLEDEGQMEIPGVETSESKKPKRGRSKSSIVNVPIDAITRDRRCQAREGLTPSVVEDYRDAMQNGDDFPPIVLFSDGESYWLADGFHRVEGALQAGIETIRAEIRDGGIRDAILYAVGANGQHGLRRTNADKRRAVMTLLMDGEWSKWSNGEIGRRASVSDHFVGGLRKSLRLDQSDSSPRRLRTDKHGNVSEMDVSQIGRSRSEPEPDDPLEQEEDNVWYPDGESSDSSPPGPSNVVSLSDHLDPDASFEEVERRVGIDMEVEQYREDLEESGGIDPDAIDKPEVRARCIAGAIGDLARWQMTAEEFWACFRQWYHRKPIMEELSVAMNVLQALKDVSDVFAEQVAAEAEAYHARNAQEGITRADSGHLEHEERERTP